MLRCQPWCQWQHQCWWQHRRQHRWDLQWVLRWRCWIHGWPVASCRIHGRGMEGWRGRGTWQQVTNSLYNINYIAQQHFRHHTKRRLDQSSAFDEKHLSTLTSSSFSNPVEISMIFQETSSRDRPSEQRMTRRKPFFAYRSPRSWGSPRYNMAKPESPGLRFVGNAWDRTRRTSLYSWIITLGRFEVWNVRRTQSSHSMLRCISIFVPRQPHPLNDEAGLHEFNRLWVQRSARSLWVQIDGQNDTHLPLLNSKLRPVDPERRCSGGAQRWYRQWQRCLARNCCIFDIWQVEPICWVIMGHPPRVSC